MFDANQPEYVYHLYHINLKKYTIEIYIYILICIYLYMQLSDQQISLEYIYIYQQIFVLIYNKWHISIFPVSTLWLYIIFVYICRANIIILANDKATNIFIKLINWVGALETGNGIYEPVEQVPTWKECTDQVYTQGNLFEILLNQPEINRKMVNTIWFKVDLMRFREKKLCVRRVHRTVSVSGSCKTTGLVPMQNICIFRAFLKAKPQSGRGGKSYEVVRETSFRNIIVEMIIIWWSC